MSFRDFIKQFFCGHFSFLNLIYNQKCLICNCAKDDGLLCKNCLKDVHYLSCFAHRIYKTIPIYSAFIYDVNIKKLIQLLKFSHKKQASKVLAYLLFEYYKKLNVNIKNDEIVIIYPKTFFLKTLSRGYNHMKLIASEFSKLSGLEVDHKLLKKTKYTKSQYRAKNRKMNIKGSFMLNRSLVNKYRNKTILILDDITTSGATLEEIIDCCLSENLNKIICLTLSKAK